jgi:hypothetical protein
MSYDFLDRGFRAFKQMGDAGRSLRAIRQRETRILDQIYARSPDPFSLAS